MTKNISAICFDVGGTLKATIKNPEGNSAGVKALQSMLGNNETSEVFQQKLRLREKTYRRWCKRSLIELDERRIWSEFLLPDYPAGFVKENALTFNQLWRASRNNDMLPDAVYTIRALKERGYRLAIISNTTSSIETPHMLAENGIVECFDSVILSCVFGRRKPHPSLFLQAARDLNVLPQHCVYIGDFLARDLIGAKQAGYGEVGIINIKGYEVDEFDPDDEVEEDRITEIKPSFRIGKLSELLDYFPAPNPFAQCNDELKQPSQLYEIALSSMWSADQPMPFNNTFTEARKLGFTSFELTSKVTPSLHEQWNHNEFYISTIHDPCPSGLSYSELKEKDIALSSTNEHNRRAAIDTLKRSIDLAQHLGSRSVVIHCGTVLCDQSRDTKLRRLYREGLQNTPEYSELSEEFISERSAHCQPHIQAVTKSLQEIIPFADGSGVALALENRNRYHDIPLPDELDLFLNLCHEPWFGFQFDVGHAHNLDRLGLVNQDEWIDRFQSRMIGVHLHDVKGLRDHRVPGTGDVDFTRIASWIPQHALRTLEITPDASLLDIAAGLEVLHRSGCINRF